MAKSGWCMGPPETPPNHAGCSWEPCECVCHRQGGLRQDEKPSKAGS